MIFLDTNVVIAANNQRAPLVRARLAAAIAARTSILISTVALYELWYGVHKSARPAANAAALATFLALDITAVPFEAEDADEAGGIRAALERAGTPIGPYDLLIAAHARRHVALLITANSREFAHVHGLRTDDWSIA